MPARHPATGRSPRSSDPTASHPQITARGRRASGPAVKRKRRSADAAWSSLQPRRRPPRTSSGAQRQVLTALTVTVQDAQLPSSHCSCTPTSSGVRVSPTRTTTVPVGVVVTEGEVFRVP